MDRIDVGPAEPVDPAGHYRVGGLGGDAGLAAAVAMAELFDQHLALLVCGLVLLCETMWQYSLSGLPQSLLMFLFNSTVYLLVRAVEAQHRDESPLKWLVAAGAGFARTAAGSRRARWPEPAALTGVIPLR